MEISFFPCKNYLVNVFYDAFYRLDVLSSFEVDTRPDPSYRYTPLYEDVPLYPPPIHIGKKIG